MGEPHGGSTNPFLRRPHEVDMGDPVVFRKPIRPEATLEPAATSSIFGNQPFRMNAPGTPPPPPPWWGIQAKLAIGQPNDQYEQEADRVAEQVMSMALPATATVQRQGEEAEPEELEEIQTKPFAETIAPLVQRQADLEEEEPIQAKCEDCEAEEPVQRSSDSATQAQPDLESQLNASKGGGSALSEEVRSFMEPRFGADFSQVRVHTDSEAVQMNRDLNAQAFTHQQDIYFGSGESPRNDALTAHELTHVVQQSQDKVQPMLTIIQPGNLHPKELVQRQDTESQERPTAEFFNLSDVINARANMELRFQRASLYSSGGLRAGDTVREKLLALSSQYRNAYGTYARVIGSARAEAQNQEFWMNICIGIGAGVLMSLGAAFILPSTAAAAFTLTASEAAVAAASGLGQAVAGAALSGGVGTALAIPGTDLQPGGLEPNVLELEIWRNVSELYRRGLEMTPACRNFHLLSNAAEYLIGEIRVHVAGGETDMSEDDVLDMVTTLLNADQAMSPHDTALSDSLDALVRLQEAANAISPPSSYPESAMEKDIWILWMSELSDPSILDLDAIEDHLHAIGVLGSGSILGVDFGWWWTSDDEEIEARDAARREAASIRGRVHSLSALP
jgi:hypothetical protein